MAVNLAPPDPAALRPVPGVELGFAEAGIRKAGRLDVMLVRLAPGTRVAGVFTRNGFAAAPVQVCREHLARAGAIRALVVNAGNANCGTGERGLADARRTCAEVAALLGCPPHEVLPFSTGVILEPLPVATTGIAKGVGMLQPDMATMLAYLATDAAIADPALRTLVRRVADRSFNRVTVDGDTSTNDSFVLMATGRSAAAPIESESDPRLPALEAALVEVAGRLAQAIARDGEGATKFITVEVGGARDEAEALRVARGIANSPLVKTAMFASDPNLGRLLMAIGNARVDALDPSRVQLWLGDVRVIEDGGRAAAYREEEGARVMRPDEIVVRVELGRGEASTTVWTCDFSYDYVKINAEYRT